MGLPRVHRVRLLRGRRARAQTPRGRGPAHRGPQGAERRRRSRGARRRGLPAAARGHAGRARARHRDRPGGGPPPAREDAAGAVRPAVHAVADARGRAPRGSRAGAPRRRGGDHPAAQRGEFATARPAALQIDRGDRPQRGRGSSGRLQRQAGSHGQYRRRDQIARRRAPDGDDRARLWPDQGQPRVGRRPDRDGRPRRRRQVDRRGRQAGRAGRPHRAGAGPERAALARGLGRQPPRRPHPGLLQLQAVGAAALPWRGARPAVAVRIRAVVHDVQVRQAGGDAGAHRARRQGGPPPWS